MVYMQILDSGHKTVSKDYEVEHDATRSVVTPSNSVEDQGTIDRRKRPIRKVVPTTLSPEPDDGPLTLNFRKRYSTDLLLVTSVANASWLM